MCRKGSFPRTQRNGASGLIELRYGWVDKKRIKTGEDSPRCRLNGHVGEENIGDEEIMGGTVLEQEIRKDRWLWIFPRR